MLKVYKIMYKIDYDVRVCHCIACNDDEYKKLFNDYIDSLRKFIDKLKYCKPIILNVITYEIKPCIF